MIIVTWNVNSIRVRLEQVLEYLQAKSPDVLLLQEIKTEDKVFPRDEVEKLGYHIETHGQKAYNGVAIIAKQKQKNVIRGLPNNTEDKQSRYIECDIGSLRLASLYLPNGNPVDSEKFDYKLKWMRKFRQHISNMLQTKKNFVLGGDWNIAPENNDVFEPLTMTGDAVFHTEAKHAFREIINLGLTDAFRALHPEEKAAYTYFDYQGRAWENKLGLRIDHLILSPWVADRLVATEIDTIERGKPRPSDHVPIWCELED